MTKQKLSDALSPENQDRDENIIEGRIEWRLDQGEQIPVLTIDEIAELLGDPTGPNPVELLPAYNALETARLSDRLPADRTTRSWLVTDQFRTERNKRNRPSYFRATLKAFFNGPSGSPALDKWIDSKYQESFSPQPLFMPDETNNNIQRTQYMGEVIRRLTEAGQSDETERSALYDKARLLSSDEDPTLFKPSNSELNAIFWASPQWQRVLNND